jgi:hypothetical protein
LEIGTAFPKLEDGSLSMPDVEEGQGKKLLFIL